MDISQIAIVTFLGGLAAYAVKELIDTLINLFWPTQGTESSLAQMEEDLSKQLDKERKFRRIHLYREFTRNIDQAVAELSIGATRMPLIYAARDYYREISREAPREVANAARRMCRVCEEIMLSEYSEIRYNRYQRAYKEFMDACVADTGEIPTVEAAKSKESESRVIDAAHSFSPSD